MAIQEPATTIDAENIHNYNIYKQINNGNPMAGNYNKHRNIYKNLRAGNCNIQANVQWQMKSL